MGYGVDSEISVDTTDGSCTGRVLTVPPDVWHRARCAGPALAFLYDPEPTSLRRLTAARAGPLEGALRARLLGMVTANLGTLSRTEVLRGLFDELGSVAPWAPPALDRRLASALELWGAGVSDWPSVGEVACRAGLSIQHFRELFTRAVGIPPRDYRSWRLLARALRAGVGRFNATRLAHEAGFADLAHFSRT